MPRFVLLRHECPESFGKQSHWDFMLEHEGVLATWNLFELPKVWQTKAAAGQRPAGAPAVASQSIEALAATKIHDHRLAYLDYEGPISGNRGEVARADRGEYRLLQQSDTLWRVELAGEQLRGTVELRKRQGDRWELLVS